MNKINRHIIHAFLGMSSMAISLLIGGFFNNQWLGVMSCFGALTLMYYVPANQHKTISQLLIVDVISILALPISALLAGSMFAILWIGMLAFISQYILTKEKMFGPQAFFILMINGMLSSLGQISIITRLLFALYIILGAVIATVFALIENWCYEKYAITFRLDREKLTYNIESMRAINYSIFAMLAYFIGVQSHLNNYYWLLVSAITILQAENIPTARHRQYHYVLAGIVGCIFALLIYTTIHQKILLMIIAVILMGIICFAMPKSYLIGNFFTTPIALILFKLVRPELGTNLIITRLIAILIGTSIGIVGVIAFDIILRQQKLT
ncbi:FUSC family protein [Leuconostoc falkenbergense]|uniref:FUSC family protein n=1 Tax=Leuconostoc falkenbergense TaxID=2766470 RepID=A0A9X3IPP8_9LACO|nr:FUSC family protein [Leuconostoc falkenbergense]MCX7578722.1 FUSC family protein [Leuconostoc falkenbergense]